MSGFDFSYRLTGAPPTIRRLPIKGLQTLSRGDMLNFEGGEADLAATRDGHLLGVALETKAGGTATTYIDAIVDVDAVYSVTDPESRSRGDLLDLMGLGGHQGVVSGPNGEFFVIADSEVAQPTLVRIRLGKTASLAGDSDDREVPVLINAAVARAVAKVNRTHSGRGPSRSEAFFRGDTVVVVMRDLMTTQEHSLASAGAESAARVMRSALHRAMKADLVRAVEQATGGHVVAFLSDSQVDPDIAAHVFVLDRPIVAEGKARN